MNRAYSLFEIKAVDDEKRIIEGIATTPTTDRVDDIVEPMGAEFSLPMPFLWQHDSRAPIGHVVRAKPRKDGIPVTVQLARTDEPGTLKDRLDEAWQSIKLGLVRGLSIGFKAKESADIEGSMWGQRFLKWEWLELSAVTIPANAEATITMVKQFDHASALSGHRVVRITSPDASGKNSTRTSETTMTITERIGAYEAKLAAHLELMNEIEDACAKRGETKNETEQEKFDTLQQEREAVKKALADLRVLEAENKAAAKPIQQTQTLDSASTQRTIVHVEREEKLEPGIEFARFAMCMAAAKGNPHVALHNAQQHYPKQQRAINFLKSVVDRGVSPDRLIQGFMEIKANVAGATTTDATWAGPLLEYNTFTGDFLDFLRPRTIIGRFGTGGIPSLRSIPFNVHIKGQTSGGTGYWVGQGKPKPVTKFDFNDTYHGFTKVAAISVISEEVIRFSNPSAERLVRDGLSGALIQKLDEDFVDPAVAAVAGVNPASITNGVTAITASGTTADALRVDFAELWGSAITANLPMTDAVIVTTPSLGLNIGLLTNALGQPEFPGVNMNGGTLLGVPVITSNHVPAGTIILVFASEIWLSDDGVVTIDASNQTALQMLDNPTNEISPVHTSMVSMYQTNSVALRAERFINWSKRRSTAVALIDNAAYAPSAA